MLHSPQNGAGLTILQEFHKSFCNLKRITISFIIDTNRQIKYLFLTQ